MTAAIQKCAIYTRKSTEKGLEQDFNSLDAQREACLAYITSQKSEGWVPIKQVYDDGGYSGGNIERPALQQLMEDIKAKKINIVVVYKIDRLTRSLADFAKLVEVFDQYGVSFVSITQSFNTTTSMGRLTLNVLLSFAQFEREVSGERIRDKIAASKKKGMWMGGHPMLGYTPMCANKKGKQYRYYVSQNLVQNRNHPKGVISRLPAHEIETSVLDAIAAEMRDIRKLSGMLGLDAASSSQVLEHITKSRAPIHDLHTSIHKVVVGTDRLTIEVSTKILAGCINAELNTGLAIDDTDQVYSLALPYYTKRACRGAVVIQAGDANDLLDRKLEPLVKGTIWRDEHFKGKPFSEIALENGCSRSFVVRLVHQSLEIA